MVTSAIDSNPLDPTTTMPQPNNIDQKPTQAHKLNELEMIIDRNVAPYANPLPEPIGADVF